MLCEEVMKRDFEWISPRDTVENAASKMREANVGFLPVCAGSRRAVGTLTDRDIAIRIVAVGKPEKTRVGDIMTEEVVVCSPKDDLEKAQEVMANNRKSRIMCVDDEGLLVGIISVSDIVRHEQAERASETLRQVSEREGRI